MTIELSSFEPSTGVVGPPDVLVSENGDDPRLCVQRSGVVTVERNVGLTVSTGTGTAQGRSVVELRFRFFLYEVCQQQLYTG